MRRLRGDWAIVVVYTLCTVVMTWPLILRLSSHLAGQDYDVWLNPWATWWTEKVISEGQSLYHTDFLFYPRGVSLAFHSFSHVNSVLELLLRPWLGQQGAYNGAVLLAHILSGYGMFCLVRYMMRDSRGAFFAGLVFAFLPYRMSESIHLHLVSTQWLPFFFLFLLRLLKDGGAWNVLLAALFFLLTALSGWHLMLLALFLSVSYLGYTFVVDRERWSRVTLRRLILLIGLVAIVLTPFLYPMVREQLTVSRSYVGVGLGEGKGNDLLAFLVPAKEHPVWGELVEPLHRRLGTKRPAYLGFTVLGLGLVGSLAGRRRARFWVLLALVSVLLSLGPYLQIGGYDSGILVPWSIPIVWLMRYAFRFGLPLGFALAVLSGFGFSAALRWLAAHRARWRWPFAGTIVALLLFEYMFLPFPTTRISVPDFYFELSAQGGEGAVLDLPMGRQPSKRYMYYQMTHGRPLVEGHVSRTPLTAYDFIHETPVLRSLRACASVWPSPGPYLQTDSLVWALPPIDLSSVLDPLAEQGIEYVILHKDWATPSSVEAWLRARTLTPDYEDEQIAAYHTWRDRLDPVGRAQLLADCIAVRPSLAGPFSAAQGEIVEIPLEWTAGGFPQDEYVLELSMKDARGETVWRHPHVVTPGIPMIGWELGSRYQVTYPLLVASALPPGSYRLQATLLPTLQSNDALLSAHLLDIHVSDRSGDSGLPEVEHVAHETFGNVLRLLGYDLDVESGAARLKLYWKVLERMETDYKFFAHLYGAGTETPAAQADVMPYNWTYPTTWWEEGEVIIDRITVPLADVSSGIYRVAIGVYDPTTGKRLPVRNADGDLEPFDRYVLQEKVDR